jgi:sugar phosphate isomerase/epimerase
VTLVLENHHGITGTADELLEIIRPIPGPGLALNADTGNFRTPDPYAELARILPYARTLQLKTEIFPKGGAAQPVDYDRLIRLIHQSGYDGDITLEYEAAAPPRQAIPQALAEIRRRWVCA